MKKYLAVILLISISASAQLTYRAGGNVSGSNSEKLKPAVVREMMKSNEQALALYNQGRNKKTWGNVLFYGGIGLGVINLYSAITKDPYDRDEYGNYVHQKSSPTLAIIGGAMFIASIPVKIGYTKKIRTAVDEYNGGVTYKPVKQSLSIMADANGVGFKVSF